MNDWTRRSASIKRMDDGQKLCEFRFTRREGEGIKEKVVQFSRNGEPGLTAADYARANEELVK
jgi:hypothetical protein